MLRILQVHNTYQQAGGEDAVVANEGALLSGRGHDVRLWSANNDEIEGAWAKLKTAWQVPYSHEARRDLAEAPYRGLFPSPPLFDRMPTYRTQGKRSLNFLSAGVGRRPRHPRGGHPRPDRFALG